MITFTSRERATFTPEERDLILRTILHDDGKKYVLMAACVMPDHAHILIEPNHIATEAGEPAKFHSLSDILQTLKSVSAHRINKLRNTSGAVWEAESFDRLIRSDSDLEEKFIYIVENPRRDGLVASDEIYPWIWTPDYQSVASQGAEESPRRGAEDNTRGACAPQRQIISGAFAFRLYDEQGFPFDLTELLARERGLAVDKSAFEELMEQQKARARAAQKKSVIELSEVETKTPTHFLGYDHAHIGADVQEVLSLKGRTVVIANNTVCYATMGGQVGDTGEMTASGRLWRIEDTQKSGNTWLHFLEDADAPEVGGHVTITLDTPRRAAIQRHHTATHLLHWALHEVVSKEATQKGSSVAPDKLTFDFNSGALTHAQVRDIERLVNERIVANDPVSWTEVPYVDVRGRADIMQFFGDKYGETVRVVQIGGPAAALNGYSMELCAGTHTRHTGEIGLFRINAEAAIAAGVRRIEAIAGLTAYDASTADTQRLHALAAKIGAPLADMEKRLEGILAQQKELEKALKAASQREAAGRAKDLLTKSETINGIPAIIANLGDLDADAIVTIAEALKGTFPGVVVLGAASNGSVSLVASVAKDHQAKVQAGKIIQTIAPIVGGKGGGKPDFARGAGKDASKLDEALAKARALASGTA